MAIASVSIPIIGTISLPNLPSANPGSTGTNNAGTGSVISRLGAITQAASASSGGGVGGALSTVGNITTAAAIVPGVGTAVAIAGQGISAIGNFFSSFVKKGTQHLGWDAANGKALTFAAAMEALVRSVAPGSLDAIGEVYRVSMISWINSIRAARWGEGNPENTQAIIDGLKSFPGGADKRSKVFVTSWLWAMWTLRNTDMDNQDEWVNIAVNDMNKTLIPAIRSVTGIAVQNFGVTGTAGSTAIGTAGAGTGTTVTAGTTSLIAGLSTMDIVLILGAIVGLIFLGKKKR